MTKKQAEFALRAGMGSPRLREKYRQTMSDEEWLKLHVETIEALKDIITQYEPCPHGVECAMDCSQCVADIQADPGFCPCGCGCLRETNLVLGVCDWCSNGLCDK
jgi:hypothetical protein